MESSSNTKKKLLLVFSVVWVFLIAIGYYYVHKPMTSDSVLMLILPFGDLLLGLGILCLAGGIGRKIAKFDSFPPMVQAALQATLGGLVLAGTSFILGTAHLYYRWVIWFLFLVGVVFFRKEIHTWVKDLLSILQEWESLGKFARVLFVTVVVFCIIQLSIALAPPVKWDTLAYHLDLPRHYLAAHSMIFIPENPFSGHPQVAEMIYTLCLGLFRNQTAAVTSWGFGIIFFVGLYGFATSFYSEHGPKNLSKEAGWVMLIALLVGYTVRYLLGWAYTDLLAALFGLSTLVLFFKWVETNEASDFRWMMLFGCGATAVKWTEGVILLGILVSLLFLRKKNPVSLRLMFESMCIGVLVIFPWLIRNTIATGNPFFPFFFPVPGYSAARLAASNPVGPGLDIWSQIFLPFSITFNGVDTAAGFSTDPGPLLLLFGLPGILLFWSDKRVHLLAAIVLPAAVAIAILSNRFGHLIQPRLYFAVLPAVAVPVGLGWMALQGLTEFQVRFRKILEALVLLIIAFSLTEDLRYFFVANPAGALFNPIRSDEYFSLGTGTYADLVHWTKKLDANSKILTLWEPRGLYLPMNTQTDLWIDRFQTDLRDLQSPEKMVEKWCSDGFTNVLVFNRGEDLIKPPQGKVSQIWCDYEKLLSLFTDHERITADYDFYALQCTP